MNFKRLSIGKKKGDKNGREKYLKKEKKFITKRDLVRLSNGTKEKRKNLKKSYNQRSAEND